MLDWETVKPRGPWVLAKSDPRAKQTKGGIILTDQITGIEKVSIESAHALRVGDGVEKVVGTKISEGDRFCFRGFLKDATIKEFQRLEDGSTVFLINAKDIIALIDEGTDVGVFS